MENPNSVCFVAKVSEISPIPGADNIELASVEGWNSIVKKGSLTQGSLVVVMTTDAVIPEKLAETLGVKDYLRKGNRVRTVKLKGVYSECLIVPMFVAGKIGREGSDFMQHMGVFKYEPPIKTIALSSGKRIKYKENSNFHVYYKFPNIKNIPDIFTEGQIVEITRKIHGTNARYGIVKKTKLSIIDRIKKLFGNKFAEYEFVVGSHNVEKGSDSQGYYDSNVWYDIEKKYDIKKKLWDHVKKHVGNNSPEKIIGTGFILYGEIYGPGIQKNYDYGLPEIKFVGFDVSLNGEYLQVYNSAHIISNSLLLDYVEILYYGPWSKEVQDKYVYNNFIKGTKVPEEGIVVKDQYGDRKKVAKVINPDYLIYSEKNNVGDSH